MTDWRNGQGHLPTRYHYLMFREGENIFHFKKLIYRGAADYFEIESQSSNGQWYHLGKRLAPITSGPHEVLMSLFGLNSIDEKKYKDIALLPIDVRIGGQFGNIQRPVFGNQAYYTTYLTDEEAAELKTLYGQFETYLYRLSEISRVIHIANANMRAFGSEIRSLLILACTEVELLFKRLLWPNNRDARGNMHCYFIANKVARLSEYEVQFTPYDEIGPIKPFYNWSGASTYIPLDWYQAYNATKHNRQFGVDGANLGALTHALAACAALLKAQTGYFQKGESKLSVFVNFNANIIVRSPKWSEEDWYICLPLKRLKKLDVPLA